MSAAAAGLIIGGTVLESYGQYQSYTAQADAAERDARLKDQQSNETIARSLINQQLMREQGDKELANIRGKYSASGISITTGAPLLVLEGRAAEISREVANVGIEASFRSRMLTESARSSRYMAAEAKSAAIMGPFTSILNRGGQLALMGAGGSTPTNPVRKES